MKKTYILLLVILLSLFIFQLQMSNKEIKIAFTGDVMLGRLVNDFINIQPPEYVWGNTLPIIKNTDLSIINQEFAITSNEEKEPKTFNFKLDPNKIKTLTISGIDYVSLANNHVLDYKEQGLIDTIKNLGKVKIKHSGAGRNIKEAEKPALFKIKGTKIAILSFSDHYKEWRATNEKPGINYIPISSAGLKKAQEAIRKAKQDNDIVIFSIHWGPNMNQYPTKEFQEFAHSIIDAGADIFHGHSAHIFQGIEIYKNKPILYDTGDFIDDYIIDPELRNDQSFIFLVTLNKNEIKQIELIPVIISKMQVNLATNLDYDMIADKMISLSEDFNTRIEKEERSLVIKL